MPTRTAWGALLVAVVSIFQTGCAPRPTPGASSTPGAREEIAVMAFNLRYADTIPPNAWAARRAIVREVIARANPDLIGTQEGLYQQVKDLDADFPAYDWIGLGREGGSRGEFMAVFYRAGRFEPLEYDHYWLSATPDEIGSRSWGNTIPRMVTWVRFRDRVADRDFVLVNTHFDHQSQPARDSSAALIMRQSERWGPNVPVILTGDFNAAAGENPVHALLTGAAGFTDTWMAAGGADTLGTYHAYRGVDAARGVRRIDWILVRGPVTTLSTAILTDRHDGRYPSDHFPVVATVRLDPPASRGR